MAHSPEAILLPTSDIETKIAAARTAMRDRTQVELDAVAPRTRILLGVVTVLAAVFAVANLHMARRR